VLDGDRGEVVRSRVGGESQCLPGKAIVNAWRATPSRQPQPD
jgi:hypothetical protein